MTAYQFRQLIEEKGNLAAAQAVNPTVKNRHQADSIIFGYVVRLLNASQYAAAGLVLWGDKVFNPRPSAVKRIIKAIEENAKTLFMGCGSVGKCLGKGTKVLMFDGSTKNVEDVKVGDRLAGDDSTARTVLSLASGVSKLYRVVPARGDPWICNKDHVLTLRCGIDRKNNRGGKISSKHFKGRIIDQPVEEYASASAQHKESYFQYSAGIEWPESAQEFDPYIYGMWIGDGGVNLPVLHNQDQSLINAWCKYFSGLNYRIAENKKAGSNCSGWFARRRQGPKKENLFTQFVRSSFTGGEKRIKKEYLVASRSQRMALLAGIIDTDGCAAGNSCSITTKYTGLADDLCFLARSLGMYASRRPKWAKCNGKTFIVNVVYISSRNLRDVPCLLRYKVHGNGAIIRTEPTNQGIKIEEAGDGEYFGFQTDGNHRFLLGDFTVTHNSYTPIGWLFMDWLRDPEYTNVKIISATKKHATSNTFSTLVKLHRKACIQLPGIITSDYIGLDRQEKKSGIAVIAIPVGDDGKGRLQGFHPDPRPQVHPILGPSSRVRAFMDECEEIPLGVWEGIDNMLVSMDGADVIKVIGAFNPKDQTSKTAQNSEPPLGWDAFDIECGYQNNDEWISKNGWHVTRIDGKKTENVRLRRNVFPGLMGYTGYRELELKDGGNSVNYFTFGRGCYPPEGTVGVLISSGLWNGSRGDFIFTGNPIRAAGVDTALDGRDRCVLTVGRVGYASAFKAANGKVTKFATPRMVLQVDQQFVLPKGDTKKMGDAIMGNCIKLGVSPEYCCIDATGNGSGVYSYLRAIWGEDVQGVDFNRNATEIKITEQDQYTPFELYEGIVSEVWFAMQKWLEFGLLAISPGLRRDPVDKEATGRRYILGKGKKLRVEKKDDFKRRMGGDSPDFIDSISVLLQGVRNRDSIMGTMVDEEKSESQSFTPQHDQTAEVSWMEDAGV